MLFLLIRQEERAETSQLELEAQVAAFSHEGQVRQQNWIPGALCTN